ncbi:hypothetical protein MRX96_031604 [Rhipicephalus microplus]
MSTNGDRSSSSTPLVTVSTAVQVTRDAHGSWESLTVHVTEFRTSASASSVDAAPSSDSSDGSETDLWDNISESSSSDASDTTSTTLSIASSHSNTSLSSASCWEKELETAGSVAGLAVFAPGVCAATEGRASAFAVGHGVSCSLETVVEAVKCSIETERVIGRTPLALRLRKRTLDELVEGRSWLMVGKTRLDSYGPNRGGCLGTASELQRQSNEASENGNPEDPGPSGELIRKLREMEDALTCTICMNQHRQVVFMCGHTTCRKCAARIAICHICRRPIERRIPLH